VFAPGGCLLTNALLRVRDRADQSLPDDDNSQLVSLSPPDQAARVAAVAEHFRTLSVWL